jgi:hypothetical protein
MLSVDSTLRVRNWYFDEHTLLRVNAEELPAGERLGWHVQRKDFPLERGSRELRQSGSLDLVLIWMYSSRYGHNVVDEDYLSVFALVEYDGAFCPDAKR